MALSVSITLGKIISILCLGVSFVWCQYDYQLRIMPYGPFRDQRFGSSVAIYQDTYAIGAQMYWTAGPGAVYVYHQDDTTLDLEAVISPDTTHQSILHFGQSLAIEDDYLVVGAPYSSVEQGADGLVFIYSYTEEGWILQRMLYPSYPNPTRFGESVAISLPYVIINGRGTAVIYKMENGYWAEDTVLHGMGVVDVDIDGEYAVLGAPEDDAPGYPTGAAYVYRQDGTRWVEDAQLLASDGEEGDLFGIAVDIDDDRILIGAYRAEGPNTTQGAAYVFQKQQNQWVEIARLSADDGGFCDDFGISVALEGNHALIGAYWADASAQQSGAAYYFQFNGSHWVQTQKFAPADLGAGAAFGLAVAIDSGKCLVGAEYAEYKGIWWVGRAYSFSNSPIALASADISLLVPRSISLIQNHPNPFNPTTTIRYDLPHASEVSLTVYDLRGREVARLVDGTMEAGYHEVQWNGREFASSIYIARLVTPGYSKSIKMVLLK